MVITFNKRELLEFSNWNIEQSKLPRNFAVMECRGIESLINWLEFKGFKNSLNQTIKEQRKEGSCEDCYTIVDLKRNDVHIFSFEPVNGETIITIDEFNKSFPFEDVKPFDLFDLDCWLKYERGIEIKTCLLYTSPSPRDQRGSRMPSSA